MDNKTEALSAIFRISEERMKEIIDSGEDLYDEISKNTGLSRSEVKHWAHNIMYSTGGAQIS